jgi:hypothetical protein
MHCVEYGADVFRHFYIEVYWPGLYVSYLRMHMFIFHWNIALCVFYILKVEFNLKSKLLFIFINLYSLLHTT